jgi:hypothetical protein
VVTGIRYDGYGCTEGFPVEGLLLVEDPVWLESPAREGAVRPLVPVAEVDGVSSVDILVLFVVDWRWDSGLGGELAVIGDQRSIASLRILEWRIGQLALFLR